MRRAIALSFSLLAAGFLCLAQAQQSAPLMGAGGAFKTAAAASCSLPTISNLVARYRADTGVTTVTGNVTIVLDQSGNGYTLVNNGTVPFNATSAYNSKPAFDFVAANGAALFTAANAVSLPATNALSVFFVGRMNSGTAASGGAASIGQGGSSDYSTADNIAVLLRTGSTASIETYYNNASPQIDTAVTTGANHRFGLVSDGTNFTHYIDNVTGSTGTGTTLALATPTNLVMGNRWAGFPNVNGGAWEGPILEWVYWAAAADSTQRSNLETYFTCQYGS